ncbi:sugar ABC transporter permease [Curtobacterium ammoniigenes]|uniref:sugar ABC transporter permease n=1 Tax=Curtobacterium ammoniigenes TaxID=395387 RepID=UPI000836E2CF|nr:ABC transporter permease [Curtobacterium ammoniigenes]
MTRTEPETRTDTMSAAAVDLQDERLIRAEGIGGSIAAFGRRVRSGDLGSLPVIIGLVVIWAIFEILNPDFLSADNLVNLALQSAPVGVISIGIVLVLLLGEIDLSVGSVSGVAAAILGVGITNLHWPVIVAVVVAIAAGAAIGALYGLLFTRFGVPSFVITLAGLLGFLGVQLWILGPLGSINLSFNSWIVKFANTWFLPPWAVYTLIVVAALAILFSDLSKSRRRRAAGLSTSALSVTLLKVVVLAVVLGVVGWYLSTDRGTGVMFVFFVALVVLMQFMLKRTRWGRSIFAVGGSVEAARRSGINTTFVYMTVFMLTSMLAIVGGLLAAGRLSAASQSAGAGDVNLDAIAAAVIGGTSLFGGRGSAWSALLGIVVIQSIASGLTLLNLNADVRYIITGAVLLVAVIVDSLSRRSRASHGQA